MIEVRCDADLARWLGAVDAEGMQDHRAKRASGQYLLLRDVVTGLPLFWPIVRASEAPRE